MHGLSKAFLPQSKNKTEINWFIYIVVWVCESLNVYHVVSVLNLSKVYRTSSSRISEGRHKLSEDIDIELDEWM